MGGSCCLRGEHYGIHPTENERFACPSGHCSCSCIHNDVLTWNAAWSIESSNLPNIPATSDLVNASTLSVRANIIDFRQDDSFLFIDSILILYLIQLNMDRPW